MIGSFYLFMYFKTTIIVLWYQDPLREYRAPMAATNESQYSWNTAAVATGDWRESRQGENWSVQQRETREKERIPRYLILLGLTFKASKRWALAVVSKSGILRHAEKRRGIMWNGILTQALSTESFKVNRPYNSSTKILGSFPQAGVSHGELEGLFRVVCCSGGWNKLIIKFKFKTASFLGRMKRPVPAVLASGNAEWQVL